MDEENELDSDAPRHKLLRFPYEPGPTVGKWIQRSLSQSLSTDQTC